MLTEFPDDSANPNDSSDKRVGLITGLAAQRLSNEAPSEGNITGAINSSAAAAGTTARIASGAIVTSGADIQVTATEDVLFDVTVGGLSAGLVGVGASVAVSSLAANVTATANGELWAGGDINVQATLNEVVDVTSICGTVGFVGLGAAVVVVNDQSVVEAAIGDGATIVNANELIVSATNNQDIEGYTGQLAAGAVAIGASFVRVDVGNDSAVETRAHIGDNVNIGHSTGTVSNITVTATASLNGNVETLGLAAGIGAGTANFAYLDMAPEVRATIGDASQIRVVDSVTLDATLNAHGVAEGTGAAVGGVAIGLMFADASLGGGHGMDEVIAGVGTGNTIEADSLQILPSSNVYLAAEAVAGAGAVVGGAGASAATESDLSVVGVVGDHNTILVQTFLIRSAHEQDMDSSGDSYALGLAAGTGAVTDSVVTSKANVEIGSGSTIQANNIIVTANNSLNNAANLRTGTAAAINVSVLSSHIDIGTASNPFQAVVNIGPGTRMTALGSKDTKNFFQIESFTDFNAGNRVNAEGLSIVGATVAKSLTDARTVSAVDAPRGDLGECIWRCVSDGPRRW